MMVFHAFFLIGYPRAFPSTLRGVHREGRRLATLRVRAAET
jgi:hypothetical protein